MKKLLITLLLCSLFIFYACVVIAQDTYIDSLKKVLLTEKEDTNKVNTLNLLSDRSLQTGKMELAVQYANRAFSLAEETNFTKGKGKALYNIGNNYYSQSNNSQARKYFVEAAKIMEETGNISGCGQCYVTISGTYWLEDNYTEALKNTYTALKYFEKVKDKAGLATCYSFIGYYYFYNNNYPEALKNYFLSSKLGKEIGNKGTMADAYTSIANIYSIQGNYDQALKMDSLALKYWMEIGYKTPIASVIMDIGKILEKQGAIALHMKDTKTAKNKFSNALQNYNQSILLFREAKDSQSIVYIYMSFGSLYTKLKDYVTARNYLEKSLSIIKEGGNKDWPKDKLKENYMSLAELDSAEGNFSQAYKDYKIYILYRDSLVNQTNSAKGERYKSEYESEKKDLLTKVEQENSRAKQMLILSALSLILLGAVIIALIQFKNNKQRRKANIVLEKTLTNLKSTQSQLIQSEKIASLGELTAGIAHEIQNPLNFVNNFSEVSNELMDEMKTELDKGDINEAKAIADDVKQNLEKINHHGKRADAIVKNMLQHSRSSTGVKEPTDINALADEYLRLSYHGMRAKDKNFNAEIKTDFDNSIGKINVVPQDIGRVLLNLYNNAFYATNEKAKQQPNGYEPTISVSTKKVNNSIELAVKDNGNGIPQKVVDKIFQPFFTTKPTGEGTGLGLSLAYDIIKAHGGEIKVETKEGQGTEFKIQLPITA